MAAAGWAMATFIEPSCFRLGAHHLRIMPMRGAIEASSPAAEPADDDFVGSRQAIDVDDEPNSAKCHLSRRQCRGIPLYLSGHLSKIILYRTLGRLSERRSPARHRVEAFCRCNGPSRHEISSPQCLFLVVKEVAEACDCLPPMMICRPAYYYLPDAHGNITHIMGR